MSTRKGANGGEKRKESEESQKEFLSEDEMGISSPNYSSPPNSQSSSSMEFGTPVKKRRLFKFWESEKKLNPTKDETIANLKSGKYKSSRLIFRCTNRAIRSTTSAGNCLNLFALDKTGEIAVVGFRELADKFFMETKVNAVYSLVGFSVQEEKAEYRSGTGSMYQIMLNADSELQEVTVSSAQDVPEIPFTFTKIAQVVKMDVKEKCDVLGVVVKNHGLESTKRGYSMRDLNITDDSMTTISLTLYGSNAEHNDPNEFDAIAVRNATITLFEDEKTLASGNDSLAWVNPALDSANCLTHWFHQTLAKIPEND